jgi:hypothetical protein
MKHLPSPIERTDRACAILAFGAVLGCASAAPDDEIERTESELHSRITLQSHSPTVCWVKDPDSTTSNAAFDAKTAQLEATLSEWEAESGLTIDWQGRCAPPSTEIDPVTGQTLDVYHEDIRILLNELDRQSEYQIPGRGCPNNNANGHWSFFPNEREEYRHCRHNVSIGEGVARNNVLHEFGHALGMEHEHVHPDSTCIVEDLTFGGVLLTAYDPLSPMHYVKCGSPGNWGDGGLTELDRLGVEIAYPPSSTVKVSHGGLAFAGGWAIRSNSTFQPSWYARGAHPSVFQDLTWKVNGTLKSTSITVSSGTLNLPVNGTALVRLDFDDPWNRAKYSQFTVFFSNAKHAAVNSALL